MIEQGSIEYLIKLGVDGLHRILESNSFTDSSKVQKQVDEYEEENNPILAFIKDCDIDVEIINEPTNEVYRRYTVFCAENSMTPMSNVVFSKQINKRLNLRVVQRKIDGQKKNIFIEG